jgi:type VI secretion system lysozyme-like protein
MPREPYTPTVLERLCGAGMFGTIDDARESVRRDLEDLLNARQGREHDIPPWFTALAGSVATYGIGQVDAIDLEVREERQGLLKAIRRAIRRFEPRLERVEVIDLGVVHPFVLRFRIEAVMRLESVADRVVFGTTLRKNGTAVVEL